MLQAAPLLIHTTTSLSSAGRVTTIATANSLGTLTGHHPTEAVPPEVHRGADGRYVAVPSSHRGESILSPEHGGNVARSELGHLFARPSSR